MAEATDLIREAINALEDESGRVEPEAVVRAASDPGSPLHEHFEWDDARASHAYRIEQARRLIRSVTVVITTETKTVSTVHYVRDPQADHSEARYVSVTQLQREPENAAKLLRYEFAQASGHMQRAENLAEALGMQRDVQRVSAQIKKLQGRLDRQQPAIGH